MGCGCGGGAAIPATLTYQRKGNTLMSDAVRMKYTGPHSGSMSYTVNGTSYRAGKFDPFIDVAPSDVAGLEALGVFTALMTPLPELIISPSAVPSKGDPSIILSPEGQSLFDLYTAFGALAKPLEDAGYSTIPGTAHHLSQAADADLLALPGIDQAALATIRAAYPAATPEALTSPTSDAPPATTPAPTANDGTVTTGRKGTR